MKENAGHIASKRGHLEILKFLNEEHNFNFNIPNSDGDPPIFLAIVENQLEVFKYLLNDCKINMEVVSNKEWTALISAGRFNRLEMVQILV